MKKKRATHVTKAEYQATTAERVQASLDGEFSREWWGYRHTNGAVHLKRLSDPADMNEAFASPFVDEVYGPFTADTRDEASLKLHELVEATQ